MRHFIDPTHSPATGTLPGHSLCAHLCHLCGSLFSSPFVIPPAISGSKQGHFGVVWGSFGGRFGVVWGSFGGRFGVVWGSVWGRFLICVLLCPKPQPPARPSLPLPTTPKKYFLVPHGNLSCMLNLTSPPDAPPPPPSSPTGPSAPGSHSPASAPAYARAPSPPRSASAPSPQASTPRSAPADTCHE